jgi:hypothetical protein
LDFKVCSSNLPIEILKFFNFIKFLTQVTNNFFKNLAKKKNGFVLRLFKYYDINLIMNFIIDGVIFYKNDTLCGSRIKKMTYPMNYEKTKTNQHLFKQEKLNNTKFKVKV